MVHVHGVPCCGNADAAVPHGACHGVQWVDASGAVGQYELHPTDPEALMGVVFE
jgi:hypothetical protein